MNRDSEPTRAAMVTAAASLGFAVVQLDGSILNIALPRIGAALGASVDGLQWTVDAYLLVFAALLLSAGALADRVGAARAFMAGFAIFAAASLACGMAPTIGALIAFRAMQGLGGALIVPCSLALINNVCRDNAACRARAVGIWTAAGGLALAAGPIASGVLLSMLGWRSIFFVNLPVAMIGTWMIARQGTGIDSTRNRRPIDVPGQILAILLLLGLVWTFIEAGSQGWATPLVFVGLIITTAAAIGFVVVERLTDEPAIPLGFFKNAVFTTSAIVGFLISVSIYGLSFALSLYFQRVLFYTPAETGWAFVPFALGITVSNLAGGWISASWSARWPMIGGLILAAAGFAFLTGIGADTAYASMLPAQLLVRFGIGIAVPPMTAAMLSTVARAQSGLASGVLNAVRQAGAAIGVALFGALLRGNLVDGLRYAVMLSAGLLAFAAVAAAYGLRTDNGAARRNAVGENLPAR